ncbi:aminotransferase class V-fold PLP-dependent enzyme [soil metagenome]|jgi:selenocysteine lyase/cysteine desulfurase
MSEDATELSGLTRERFGIFRDAVYINSCSQGALSDAVRQSYTDYLRDWDDKGSPWEYWMERMETVRSSFAGLINADPDEVAVTTSASAGVSALATGLPLTEGRTKIVVSDLEFPTIGQIWHAQELRGAKVVHVPTDGPIVPLEWFDQAIDRDTALVSITQICYRNGARIDVPAVVELAHSRGAYVLLDSYQAVGAIPIDVKALDVDFLTAGALKYLLGSAGLAFFYCRAGLSERIFPAATGWFCDTDIFEMDNSDYSPAPNARRFQSGTPPVPSIYAGIAGIQLIKQTGVDTIAAHVQALNDRLISGVDALGGQVVTPKDPAQRGPLIAIAATDEHQLVAALQAEGIITSCRDGNLRVSPHLYNDSDDIDTLLAALERHPDLLAT